MDGILNSGISTILWFQSLGDWLVVPMKFFSFLGSEDFYLLIIPVVYWGFDAALGLRLGLMIALTKGINTIFKFSFHSPRPYWVNTDVQALSAEASFGLPSGHAQNSFAFWGVWGSYARKAWVWALVTLMVLGISLSRLYLAVHFPVDTLMGWLVGLALLVAFNRLWEPVAAWAKKQRMAKQIVSAFIASMVLLLVGVGVKMMLGSWTMPAAWSQNAARAGGELPNPFALSGLVTSSATLFGLLTGLAWIAPHGGYRVAPQVRNRILQYWVGLVGIGVLYVGLKVVFPSGDDLVAYIFRFVRYTLVSFWVTGLAPFIFIKLNLSE